MIVHGLFSTLLKPGLVASFKDAIYPGKIFFVDDSDNIVAWIEEQERLAIVHPDTSQAPIWRRPPRHLEVPITAYRCWDFVVRFIPSPRSDQFEFLLQSVAAQFVWEGPFVRSDARPIDPKLWDEAKRKQDPDADNLTHHVFKCAGIHAVKDLELLGQVTDMYDAPVYGEIAIWGRVAQFELGYRAEYAMIKKLWVRKNNTLEEIRRRLPWMRDSQKNAVINQIIKDLSNRYGCDVELK